MIELTKAQVRSLKKSKAVTRKIRYTPSQLDKFKGELIKLKTNRATLSEMREFLRVRKIKTVNSTIHSWLKKQDQV